MDEFSGLEYWRWDAFGVLHHEFRLHNVPGSWDTSNGCGEVVLDNVIWHARTIASTPCTDAGDVIITPRAAFGVAVFIAAYYPTYWVE